ncbi:hypothetical protein C8J57DRAFT_1235140 [Mycena rebaudengoi]|nr:hypothetical protein C8J57DRAFT_1235140 [Mycena rebaudengoi]
MFPVQGILLVLGCPVGALDALIGRSIPTSPIIIPDDDDDDDPDQRTLELMDAMERAGYAEAAAKAWLEKIHTLEAQVLQLQQQLARAQDTIPIRSQAMPGHLPTTPTRTRPSGATNHSPAVHGTPVHSPPFHSHLRNTPSRRPPPSSPSGAPSWSYLDDPDAQLAAVIAVNDLHDMSAVIRLVMRGFHATEWHEELERLQILRETIPFLLNAMASAQAQ